MNAPAEAFRFQALAKEIAAELRAKVRSEYETVLNMKTAKALGLDGADIDPAERGRVDRIGIPQRKKTGSPTAAMGQTLPSRDFCGTAALPLKPDIGWRGWHVRKVP